MSSNEGYFSPTSRGGSGTGTPSSRRRPPATSSFRMPSLQEQPSTQSSQGSMLGDQLDCSLSQRSTHNSRREGQQSDAEHARRNENRLERQRTEKKADESFYVDNDYYSLNPWYDREPPRPLFGLGKPFPRTVRRGMLWGLKGAPKQQGRLDIEVLDEHGRDPGPPPDIFITDINGYPVEVRRVRSREAGREEEQGVERQDHYDSEQSQDGQGIDLGARKSYTPRYQGGLSTVNETDTASTETSETQQEKREAQSHHQQELQDFYNNYRNPLARLRARFPEAPAEFLATTIYIFFGIAGNLYSVTYPTTTGDYQTQSWAWGLAVTAGIYVGGGISGAHMSPWVSVCFAIFRGFRWKKCLVYGIAQMLAGFVAGALAWGIYRDAIHYTDPNLTPDITGKAFYAIPATYITTTTAFLNNFVSAAVYVCVAFAIGDDSNIPPGSGMSALIYGLMTYLLCITTGNNGLGISPARDLGPRCVAWWVGYGRATFSTGWWAIGPIAGGLTGTLFGALVYDVLIFVGGESPVNYRWPKTSDIKLRAKLGKDKAKQNLQELPL